MGVRGGGGAGVRVRGWGAGEGDGLGEGKGEGEGEGRGSMARRACRARDGVGARRGATAQQQETEGAHGHLGGGRLRVLRAT